MAFVIGFGAGLEAWGPLPGEKVIVEWQYLSEAGRADECPGISALTAQRYVLMRGMASPVAFVAQTAPAGALGDSGARSRLGQEARLVPSSNHPKLTTKLSGLATAWPPRARARALSTARQLAANNLNKETAHGEPTHFAAHPSGTCGAASNCHGRKAR